MKIKGFLKDIGGASRVTKMRREMIRAASTVPDPKDPIRELADALHPGRQTFVVTQVRDASPTSRTYRFEPAAKDDGTLSHIPAFQAGQYVTFFLQIGGSLVSRAYTISSAPYEAQGAEPYFEVTIRRNVSYFVPDYFFENVHIGCRIDAALPYGTFYYEPLRDARKVVALAGGSGITPFVSMAREIAHGTLPVDLTILYGSVKSDDIVCGEVLAAAEEACAAYRAEEPSYEGCVKVVHVMSGDPDWQGETGFITRELIEKYSEGDTTYMFCGPLAMYRAVSASLDAMGVTLRRFRHDVMAQPSDVRQIPGFPEEQIGQVYRLTVVRGIQEDVIEARADEPVAVAIERAGILVDTRCRGGECGFCRSQLLSGSLFYSPLGDGRRKMDKEMGWFHACSAYPVSDVKVKIPIL